MSKRRVQVTLTLMPGAEPWVRVEHDRGWFKVPGDAQIVEVLDGALKHWSSTTRRILSGERYVRIPLSLWNLVLVSRPELVHDQADGLGG